MYSHIAPYCVRLSAAMINVAASDTMHADATQRDGTRSKEHDETCHMEGGETYVSLTVTLKQ